MLTIDTSKHERAKRIFGANPKNPETKKHLFNFNLVVPCLVSFCTQVDEIVRLITQLHVENLILFENCNIFVRKDWQKQDSVIRP